MPSLFSAVSFLFLCHPSFPSDSVFLSSSRPVAGTDVANYQTKILRVFGFEVLCECVCVCSFFLSLLPCLPVPSCYRPTFLPTLSISVLVILSYTPGPSDFLPYLTIYSRSLIISYKLYGILSPMVYEIM